MSLAMTNDVTLVRKRENLLFRLPIQTRSPAYAFQYKQILIMGDVLLLFSTMVIKAVDDVVNSCGSPKCLGVVRLFVICLGPEGLEFMDDKYVLSTQVPDLMS